jgi:hypothetical protein
MFTKWTCRQHSINKWGYSTVRCTTLVFHSVAKWLRRLNNGTFQDGWVILLHSQFVNCCVIRYTALQFGVVSEWKTVQRAHSAFGHIMSVQEEWNNARRNPQQSWIISLVWLGHGLEGRGFDSRQVKGLSVRQSARSGSAQTYGAVAAGSFKRSWSDKIIICISMCLQS